MAAIREDGADLYRRFSARDERAYEEVFALALGVARRRLGGGAAEAEDIAAEVVEKLLRPGELARIRDPGAFRGYIAVMAARAVIDCLRHPSRRRRVNPPRQTHDEPPPPEPADPQPGPPDLAGDRQAWAVVDAAIARLPADDQRVFRAWIEHILLDPRGSYKTLALALGSSRGNISSRVRRAVDKLLKDPRVRAALALE